MLLQPILHNLCCSNESVANVGAVADPVNAPAKWIVPRLDDVAAGTAVDALTDKTEPVIERPDPNVILVAAGDELLILIILN